MRYYLLVFIVCIGILEAGSVEWDRRGIHQYCRDVEKRLGWKLAGEGYFRAEPAVSPSIQFDASQCLCIEEARHIIVNECEYLIQLAGRTQPKRVTQVTGPFSIRNIAFSVSFRNPITRLLYEPPLIAGFFVTKGKVVYYSRDNTTRRDGTLHEEPYEEAVRIVEAEQAASGMCTHAYP